MSQESRPGTHIFHMHTLIYADIYTDMYDPICAIYYILRRLHRNDNFGSL